MQWDPRDASDARSSSIVEGKHPVILVPYVLLQSGHAVETTDYRSCRASWSIICQ